MAETNTPSEQKWWWWRWWFSMVEMVVVVVVVSLVWNEGSLHRAGCSLITEGTSFGFIEAHVEHYCYPGVYLL
jgi:hypothetical protein